ncbi:MAG: MATE family efflux transporter [Oscillospiraceae bacterium]|nr:MATE family efflux transporter [Oscillospiraceae bacterium]
MTEGSISGKMLRFAAPVFIGNLFQQLYNVADALIVGNFVGNDALAAVSATGNLSFLLISFFVGVSIGAGVVISRYFGARDVERMRLAIHTAVAFNLVTSAMLTLAGTTLTPWLLRLMGTPEDVMELSVNYIRIIFAGSIGMVMYNSLCGIMRAVGDSRTPLYFLIVSSLLNVVLDLLLVAAFSMGVIGAALATIVSQIISALLCAIRLMRSRESHRLVLRELGFDREMLRLIVRYGLPTGMQNSVIAIANVVVQSYVNSFGTMAVAGCGAYSKIEGFAFLPITSFQMALTTFVGQNLGAREHERARRGARFGILCSLIAAELIGVTIYLIAPHLLGAFTSEPEAIAFGVSRAKVCSVFFFLLAASHCLSAVLRGAGKANIPMLAMLIFWCVVRVSFLSVVMPYRHTIEVVNWVYPLTWFLSTVFLIVYYLRADWLHSFDKEKAQAV